LDDGVDSRAPLHGSPADANWGGRARQQMLTAI